MLILRRVALLLCSLALLLLLPLAAQAQSITWLGRLNYSGSKASAVSSDGKVVCGWLQTDGDSTMPFRWTRETGIQPIGTMNRRSGFPTNISNDGSTIVGYLGTSNQRAFKWTAQGGMIQYEAAIGCTSTALCVSGDGSIVGGFKAYDCPTTQACLWYSDGTISLRDSNTEQKSIVGMSEDGSIMVGSHSYASYYQGLIWVGDSTWKFLPRLTGTNSNTPTSISRDGNNIVGICNEDILQEHRKRAYLASSGTKIRDLGSLGGIENLPYGVSSGKPVVVGVSNGRAFIWTEAAKMQSLNTVFASLLKDNSVLSEAVFISADARYIVGSGYNRTNNDYEAFLIERVDTTASAIEEEFQEPTSLIAKVNVVDRHLEILSQLASPCQLSCTIYDVIGRPVLKAASEVHGFGSQISIDVSILSSGVYFYLIQSPYGTQRATLLLN